MFFIGLQLAAFIPMFIYGFNVPALWLPLIFITILTLVIRFRNYYQIKDDHIFISASKEIIPYADIVDVEDIDLSTFKINYKVQGEQRSQTFHLNMKDRLLQEIMLKTKG